MVSGRYVAPHFLQYAAQLGNDASAEYKGRQVSKMGTQIDANMGTQNSALLSEILRNAKMDTMARQRRAMASQPTPPLPAYNDAPAENPRGANPYAYTGN